MQHGHANSEPPGDGSVGLVRRHQPGHDSSRARSKELIDAGVTGLTSNPTIFHKAITESSDYDDELMSLAEAGKGTREIFETMAIADIRDAADLLRPVFDATGGADGFASFEVSPRLAHDTEGTIHEARRLFSDIDRPNIMIKVPATPEGIPAIETLIGEGINVNVTLIFSLDSHRRVVNAYISGLERLNERGGDLSTVSSVASFFVSRVDTAVDNLLDGLITDGRDDSSPCSARRRSPTRIWPTARSSGSSEARVSPTFGEEVPAPSVRSGRARVSRILPTTTCSTCEASWRGTPSTRCRERPSTPSWSGA